MDSGDWLATKVFQVCTEQCSYAVTNAQSKTFRRSWCMLKLEDCAVTLDHSKKKTVCKLPLWPSWHPNLHQLQHNPKERVLQRPTPAHWLLCCVTSTHWDWDTSCSPGTWSTRCRCWCGHRGYPPACPLARVKEVMQKDPPKRIHTDKKLSIVATNYQKLWYKTACVLHT